MTETLTTSPPTDDLVVPFHCDRCGALAKVRVVLPSGTGLTNYGESGHNGSGSGIRGSILALCRRPIRNRGSVR